MPTYIMLLNWTDHGVTNVKNSPTRLDAFKQALQQAGGQLKGFYMVTGLYDMIGIAWEWDDRLVPESGPAASKA